MAVLFLDSFDHYTSLSTKWSDGKTALVDLSGTRSRTGIGACLCFPFGPQLNVSPSGYVVMGTAYNTQTLEGDIFGAISGSGTFATKQVRAVCNSDGSIAILAGNDPFPATLGTTPPNLVSTNIFAYLEMKVSQFSGTGTVTLRVNGQIVLTVTGNTNPDGTGTYETFYLAGPGSGLAAAHDDVYLLNATDSGVPGQPNNDFLGAIRNYAQVPIADSSPLQWTPLTGQNFEEVSEIPPDGDTSYVSSGTVGNVDQYVYGTSGIVPPVRIFAVQHCLDARIDISGSRSIASDVSGVVGPSFGVSTDYNMVKTQYDGNPVNNQAWQLTDFATVRFGPKVTA